MEQPQAPSGVTSNNPDAPTSQPAPDTRPPEEQPPQEESGQADPGHFDPETGNLTQPETTEPLDDDFNDQADGEAA
jgi:hypothetical protein